MSRRLYGVFLFVLACCVAVLSSVMPALATSKLPKERIIATVNFSSIVPSDKLAVEVYDLWMKLPEYQDSVKKFDMPPTFFAGYADINEDGQPEVFAQHIEPGYCSPDNQDLCLVHVYTKTPKGLVEVAKFVSTAFIGISESKRKNVHDIITSDDEKIHRYVWNGRVYEQKD